MPVAPAPQAVRAASRVNIRMLGMAYARVASGRRLVWRRYDVCRTFARSSKTVLRSQLEPFSPILEIVAKPSIHGQNSPKTLGFMRAASPVFGRVRVSVGCETFAVGRKTFAERLRRGGGYARRRRGLSDVELEPSSPALRPSRLELAAASARSGCGAPNEVWWQTPIFSDKGAHGRPVDSGAPNSSRQAARMLRAGSTALSPKGCRMQMSTVTSTTSMRMGRPDLRERRRAATHEPVPTSSVRPEDRGSGLPPPTPGASPGSGDEPWVTKRQLPWWLESREGAFALGA
jgi:hypothetical protein